ncbi:MAG: ribonuclease Z [Candidatus Magasanikbacteria bacterium]
MKIIFLGTNGWYDSAVGSTVSALIDSKDAYIILDAGFGIVKARDYIKEDKPVYLFLTHFHMDHVCGLHALSRLNIKQPLTIFSHSGLKKMLKTIFDHPYAMPLSDMSFQIKTVELKEGNFIQPIKFECRSLDHIDYTFGYRFYLEDKIISYCSDTKPCINDIKLADGADLLIHECGWNIRPADDFWGHTDPEGAGEVAAKARAKKLCLTHFGPNAFETRAKRFDGQKRARKIFKNTLSAFDGMVVKV